MLGSGGRRRLVTSLLSLTLCTGWIFAQAPRASIEGTITFAEQPDHPEAIPGIAVTLTVSSGGEPVSATTDAEGRYRFSDLSSGTYKVDVQLQGFKHVSETIALRDGSAATVNVAMELEKVVESIEVRDKTATVPTDNSDASAVISMPQFTRLPLTELKFKAALPLVPGVVRTRDGQLNFKGAPENQSMLLVDSMQTVDPVTGSFSIPVPLDAIQSMTVEKAPYGAQYGGFSGGLTSIETKPPSGAWNYGLMDFIPGARGRSGKLVGISNFTPRLFFGGPLIKDKLNFSEAITYDVNKRPVRGLPWPDNETRRQGFDSLTSFQAMLSPQHLFTWTVNGFSNRTRDANISALVPQSASSDDGLRGVSIGANDSYQFASGALVNTIFRYTRFDSDAHGQGTANMQVTPEGWRGNFFDTWNRTSDQYQLEQLYQSRFRNWHGQHQVKAGVALTRRSYDGTDRSHPVDLLRPDGTLAERIVFQGNNPLHAGDTEVAEFVQDHWAVNDRLALDLGGRFSSQTQGRSAAFAPRAALVYAPTADRKMIIRAGAGLFYDRVPLLALGFADNPTRVSSFYSPTGVLTNSLTLQNAYVAMQPGRGLVPVRSLDTSPRNTTWNVEVDREIRPNAVLRFSYLYSRTKNLNVATPIEGTGGVGLMGLSSTGGSHYHEFEATLHYRPTEKSDVNVSYIRSHVRGDLNTLSSVFVPFQEAVIRPNQIANLAQDMPNRVVGWGLVSLLGSLRISPVVDIHSGLPYSNVDTLQNYVGAPNTQRFPNFFSLDVKVYRDFQVHLPFLGKRKTKKIRFSLYTINLTNHSNPLSIYNNIGSSAFGHFVGFQHRVNGFVLDAVN